MLQAIEKREEAVDTQPLAKDPLSFPERVSFGGLLARSIGEMLRPGGELAGVGLEVSGIQRARSGGAFLEVAVSDGQALVLLYAASTAIAFKNGQGAMSALAAAWDADGRRLRRAARELGGALANSGRASARHWRRRAEVWSRRLRRPTQQGSSTGDRGCCEYGELAGRGTGNGNGSRRGKRVLAARTLGGTSALLLGGTDQPLEYPVKMWIGPPLAVAVGTLLTRGVLRAEGGGEALEILLKPQVFAYLGYWMQANECLEGVEPMVANNNGPETRVRVADSDALARLFGATLALQDVITDAIEPVNTTWSGIGAGELKGRVVDLDRVLFTRRVMRSGLNGLMVDRSRHDAEPSEQGGAAPAQPAGAALTEGSRNGE